MRERALPSSALPVTVVGIGDDGPAGLGRRAHEAISSADIIAGGRRHLAFFEELAVEKLLITNNVDAVLERLQREAGRRRCVVLASGDPCFFGIGPLVVDRLGPERVEIIPCVSSVALAFARLGLGWHDATILSAHGRPIRELLEPALRARKLAILTDEENTPGAIADALLEAGLPDCPAVVLEHLGGAAERVTETRLASLPGERFAALNVLVVLPDGGPRVRRPTVHRRPRAFGLPEAEFRSALGQITKAEARAVALAKLRLPPNGVLWDVGAGSGSLAIEASGLMPGGVVYAVERDPEQLACLRENQTRFDAVGVRIVEGEAPTVLRELPRPDRIFVGGGGVLLGSILEVAINTLHHRGRLVCNAATMDSALEAERYCRGRGWRSELVQLAVSRGQAVGGRTRLEALNPVFIVAAWPAGSERHDG